MKAIKDNKRNCWKIEKGKTVIYVFPMLNAHTAIIHNILGEETVKLNSH